MFIFYWSRQGNLVFRSLAGMGTEDSEWLFHQTKKNYSFHFFISSTTHEHVWPAGATTWTKPTFTSERWKALLITYFTPQKGRAFSKTVQGNTAVLRVCKVKSQWLLSKGVKNTVSTCRSSCSSCTVVIPLAVLSILRQGEKQLIPKNRLGRRWRRRCGWAGAFDAAGGARTRSLGVSHGWVTKWDTVQRLVL